MKASQALVAALLVSMVSLRAFAVDVRAYIVARTNGDMTADATRVAACLDDMNFVYSQVGVEFNLRECSIVTSNELYVVDYTNAASHVALCNYAKNTGGIELYFVGEIVSSHARAFQTKRGIVVGPDATPRDVSHEIGHACGWKDIYESHVGTSLAVEGHARKVWLPDDWSPYYPRGIAQVAIIHRLLMYGRSGDTHIDIPGGNIHGLWYTNVFNQATHAWTRDWRVSLAPVSAWHGMNRNPQSE